MRLIILFILITGSLFSQDNFSLSEAIAYALKNSSEMKSIDLDISDAEAQLTEFKAIGMPKLSAGINYQHYLSIPVNPVTDFITPAVYAVLENEQVEGVDPFQGPPETFEFSFFQKNNLSANVDASWLLFDGSYLTGLRGAKLFRELTKKALDVKEEQIKANITKAYMNVLIVLENKKTLENNLENINQALNEAKALYDNGFLEKLDVDRILLSYENVKTEEEKVTQLIDLSHNLLKFQMSYPLNRQIILSEDITSLVNLLKVESVDLNAEVDYSHRPEFSQIEMSENLNELNIERLRKGYLPNVMAKANFNESLQRNNLFSANEIGFIASSSVSLGINIPIYDGNEKKGKIQQAKIKQEKIGLQKSEFQRAVDLQVMNAKIQFTNAKSTLVSREKSLEIVQGIYNKTQIKFKEGVGSSIEVTQSESQLFDAQSKYINALYDLLTAKTDLDIALGKI